MHEQFLRLAERLINANGREVDLIIYDESPEPWEPEKGKKVSKKITVVQTEFEHKEFDGGLVGIGDKIFLVAASVKITTEHKIRDTDNITYNIKAFKNIQPGTTNILYMVHCYR